MSTPCEGCDRLCYHCEGSGHRPATLYESGASFDPEPQPLPSPLIAHQEATTTERMRFVDCIIDAGTVVVVPPVSSIPAPDHDALVRERRRGHSCTLLFWHKGRYRYGIPGVDLTPVRVEYKTHTAASAAGEFRLLVSDERVQANPRPEPSSGRASVRGVTPWGGRYQ